MSDHGQISLSKVSLSRRLLTQNRALLRDRHLTRKDVIPDTTSALTEETPRTPLGPKLTRFLGSLTYVLVFVALVFAAVLVSVTAANMLPGVTAIEGTRAMVVLTTRTIVSAIGYAFCLGLCEGGSRGNVRTIARRSIHTLVRRSSRLLGVLGVRRSPRQVVTAIWLGIAGGGLAYGLNEFVMATVRFPPSTQPDIREAAIAGVAPITGGAFFALHAALWEETLWRGLLLLAVAAIALRWSNRRTQLITTLVLVVVTSAAFGYTHQTFSTANTITAGISGLVYGAIALHQRSLWPAVIAHATTNFAVGVITLTFFR